MLPYFYVGTGNAFGDPIPQKIHKNRRGIHTATFKTRCFFHDLSDKKIVFLLVLRIVGVIGFFHDFFFGSEVLSHIAHGFLQYFLEVLAGDRTATLAGFVQIVGEGEKPVEKAPTLR